MKQESTENIIQQFQASKIELRDWFAGQALAGIMARQPEPVDCRHVDIDRIGEYLDQQKVLKVREAIQEAMMAADEAIAAREKGTK